MGRLPVRSTRLSVCDAAHQLVDRGGHGGLRAERRVVQLDLLERDVSTLHVGGEASVFASLCVGFGPPIAVLGSALFFDTGVWPLGLLAMVIALVQVLLMPWLNRRTP